MDKAIILSLDSKQLFRLYTRGVVAVPQRTAPSRMLPIDVYTYVKKKGLALWAIRQDSTFLHNRNAYSFILGRERDINESFMRSDKVFLLNGSVFGEWFLHTTCKVDPCKRWSIAFSNNTGMSREEAIKYGKGKPFYLWYISLKDKPLSKLNLDDFSVSDYTERMNLMESNGCSAKNCPYAAENTYLGDDGACYAKVCPLLRMKKAPKGWGYVSLV